MITEDSKSPGCRTLDASPALMPVVLIFVTPVSSFAVEIARRRPFHPRSQSVSRYDISVNDLSLADYRALAEFRYQIRKFLHFSEGQARAYGLEPQQHQLLLAMRGLPAGKRATIGELAERLRLKHHSTVELVNRLEASGAVTRVKNQADGRTVIVQLTPAGAVLLRKLSLAHRHELENTGPGLARALRAVMRASNSKQARSA